MRSAVTFFTFFLDKAEPISTRDTSSESIIPEQEKRRDDMRAVVLVPFLKQQRENRDAASAPAAPGRSVEAKLACRKQAVRGGGYADHPQVFGGPAVADAPCQFITVHIRHVVIGNDELD